MSLLVTLPVPSPENETVKVCSWLALVVSSCAATGCDGEKIVIPESTNTTKAAENATQVQLRLRDRKIATNGLVNISLVN